ISSTSELESQKDQRNHHLSHCQLEYHFLVTGVPRCATSPMMRSLIFGGLEAVYDSEYKRVDEEYNPYGCFELSREQMKENGFLGLPERKGKVCKVMYKQLCKIDPSSQYKIALMLRDPRDIRESQKRAIGAAIYPAHDDRVYWY